MSKVWVTKYALTEGIIEFDTDRDDRIEICYNVDYTGGNMLLVKHPPHFYDQFFHGKGKQWHDDSESAMKQAEAMRMKKIASLQKQVIKLTNLIITIKR